MSTSGPERRPDRQLPCPLRDGVRQHADQANGSHDERERGAAREQDRVEPWPCQPSHHPLFHGHDFRDETRIGRADGRAQSGPHRCRIDRRAQEERDNGDRQASLHLAVRAPITSIASPIVGA
jgi:hypothetical protein